MSVLLTLDQSLAHDSEGTLTNIVLTQAEVEDFHVFYKDNKTAAHNALLLRAFTPFMQHQRAFLLEKHDMFCKELRLLALPSGVNATDRHLTVFRQLDPDNMLRVDISMPGMGQGGSRLLIDTAFTDTCNASNAPTAALRHKEALKRIID
eukprot:CAMPEP_0114452396 /NCGR_PEP_ID=MMETSP0104-20121206/1492_1 /TAXON_ID=37642 ORGANISM="Paraphysomonas imperforata, Strain PA2" /NCGR_SAMPLE_ID=MMETSP0104 /ASSEMBLY_ACC=CAM_ASM_000202 /LENGTH=149 /DNA_ID=CAMNT_0001624643 /DNA_START=161 /DNA_END=610 /DNA_ORIENTATION=+